MIFSQRSIETLVLKLKQMPKTEIIESLAYNGQVKISFYPNSHRYKVDDAGVAVSPKGVTTILGIKDKSAALVSWATELGRDYLLEKFEAGEPITALEIFEASKLHTVRKEEAADIGTKIHDWCEGYIKSKLGLPGYEILPALPEEKAVQLGVSAFLDWEHEHKVKFVSSERMIYSRMHKYVGTMDIEAIIDGKLALVDLKSSNGLYNSVRMQTAAYAMADMEEFPEKKYQTRWAIRLAKETEGDYHARMLRKGKTGYPDYQVFEAKEFPVDLDRDCAAFLAAKALFDWDKETDFYLNREK